MSKVAEKLAAIPSEAASPSQAEYERMQHLAAELRCLVCQNQTIADSNSGLAIDLRGQITEQIRAGKSDLAIKEYMAERYGQFVLYNPPFTAANAALWIGPFLLLLIGVAMAWRAMRSSATASTATAERTIDAATAAALEERYRKDA
ncbi:cytochrome c-type biogenesis protein CcmH [Janthinobacterium sp. CG_23.3]|uniref:cytochrome c-type biogenesis protein n=1 Tax=Janthinobacterium sp. CG_23.3 TaxID=3349634 RepID=UPI0038D44915